MKHSVLCALLSAFVVYGACNAQSATYAPDAIVRNIEQDRDGNIWIASFEGMFRYDGRSFTNVTTGVSSARFFSVLEDSKGDLWFGSIGAGVYRYDGRSFQNLTTKDGLLNNEVSCIYEDRAGNIWLGVNGGMSRYDGKSFRNYILEGDGMVEDRTGKTVPDLMRPPKEVNSIIEDKNGKLWVATRGSTFVHDGKTFAAVAHDDKLFTNVRTLIEDKKGNIWLSGNDGLWRFDGKSFTNFTQTFVGYVYEDSKGNIWTSSGGTAGQKDWALSKYDGKSLSDKNATPAEIIQANEGMIFGIMEAKDGSIWFGTLGGVKKYDGEKVEEFRGK